MGRFSHRPKQALNNLSMFALTGQYALSGIAASLKKGWRMIVPGAIPYPTTLGQPALGKPPPVWATSPSFSLTENGTGYTGSNALGVSAGGAVITISWVSTPITGITFTSGVSPTIVFTNVAVQSGTAITLRATANGQTANSQPGTITVSGTGTSDWATRIADPGVVWYHNFDNAAEVNNFRWSNSYVGGNDPLGVGNPYASNIAWVASGGVDGGGYMRMYRPAGTAGDSTHWMRMFNPLTGASNGRGVNDPAAGGTMTCRTYGPVSDGSAHLYNWPYGSYPGWYGHSDYHSGVKFDGTDFYVQLRVKVDPNRTTSGNIAVGKLFSLTMVPYTAVNQEIVTYSAWPAPSGAGNPNIHNMYLGPGGANIADVGTGTPENPNSPQWAYSFGWDTLLYHVTPGHNNVTDTRVEVWAAHEGESSYTKIWDTTIAVTFDGGESVYQNGWNAVLCWIYQNGLYNTAFYQSYDQIIFSKNPIACPQPVTALETLAATMSAGQWAELTTTGFSGKLLPNSTTTQQSPIIEFTDKMAYDPVRKQLHVLGCARGDVDPAYQCGTTDGQDAGYSIYDESTNSWARGTTAPVNSAPHGYDHCAVNATNGDYYYITSGQIANPATIYYRAGGSTNWSTQTGPYTTGGTTTFALEIFPERNELTIVDGGDGFQAKLWRRALSGGSWTSLNVGTFPSDTIGAYSCFSRYSPAHQCLYFGGGVASGGISSPNHLYKYTSAGSIVKCADPPAGVSLGVGGGGGRQCIDPVTGNLLFFSQPTSPGNGVVYSFNGTVWTQHSTHPLGTSGNELIAVFEKHDAAGVVMAVNWNGNSGSKVYLYRHA